MANWLRLFFSPGDVVELRALNVERSRNWTHTESGYFDFEHLGDMAAAALEIERHASGVYFTLNPLKPVLLSVRRNRTGKAKTGELAADPNVLQRRWMLVDADPVRAVSGIPSTDAEKAAAWDVVNQVREYLTCGDWPDPIMGDSGNGYHLLYRIDLPGLDNGLVRRCLESLAVKFDTEAVKIDRTVFNSARITRLYGTLNRKGDHTEERPHRRSRIIHIPEELER